jgi:hypothetical protein
MKTKELVKWGIKFPVRIVKTVIDTPVRQAMVGADCELTPSGTIIEEFPNLPYIKAVGATVRAILNEPKQEGWLESEHREKIQNRSTPEERKKQIEYLSQLVEQGLPESEWALEELSGAAPDNEEARKALQKLESIGYRPRTPQTEPNIVFRLIGGVPESAWSQKDQERMRNGQKPQGHPEHPNV